MKHWIVASTSLLLSGCIGMEEMRSFIVGKSQDQLQQMEREQQRFKQNMIDPQYRLRLQEVSQPWLAGTVAPLDREVILPQALQAGVQTTLIFSGNATDLQTLADRIMLVTKIPVRIQPDAMLPASHFMPALANYTEQMENSTVAKMQKMQLPQGEHPLASILDVIAHRLNIYWRYRQQSIEFYRTETRTFDVKALTLKANTTVALGRKGASNDGVFESTGSTRFESTAADTMAAIKEKLRPFMTRSGTVAANSDASNLIVVNDTVDALDRIQTYLEKENKALSRRIRLVFERVEVQMQESAELGIDWNILARSLQVSSGGSAVSSLATQITGIHSNGSTGVLKALSEMGSVVSHTAVPLQGLNRRPITHAVRTTFSYIDQVQTTTVASSAGTSTAPSVNQKEETVGSFLTVVPDIQSNGEILLSVSYDNTVALPLKTITFGNQDAEVILQQKTIDGVGTIQQVQVLPGQPIIISGFENTVGQSEQRRLDKNIPLIVGGSGKTQTEKMLTLMIVTAFVEESQ